MYSPAALTATAVCTNGLAFMGLNTVPRVDESVAVFTETLVAPFSVVADLLTVVRLLGTLVDVKAGDEIAGEPEAVGAGTLVAACCVAAVGLTVVQVLVFTLVNVQTHSRLTYNESEEWANDTVTSDTGQHYYSEENNIWLIRISVLRVIISYYHWET